MLDNHRSRGRSLLLFVALMLMGLADARAGRVLIDFGSTALPTPSPDAAGRHWNSAGLAPGATQPSFEKLDLVDDAGKPTGWSLTMPSPVLGAFDSGMNAQELYPPTAGKDRWSLEKGKVEAATLVISGLDPSQTYDFHFFAVRDAPVSFVSKYEVNGKAVTLAANNNRSNLGTVSGVKPDAEGRAVIEYSIADGPNAHLSVLEITWGGVAPTRPGQFTAAYQSAAATPPPPPPAPAPVAQSTQPAPPPAPAPVAQPAQPTPAPAPVAQPAPPQPSSTASTPQPPRPAATTPGRKGLLYAGISLLVIGLGLAGFSAYKLFAAWG